MLQGKWSQDEDDQLRQLVGEKGSKWAEISRSLNRLPEGCRDRWRELKLGDAKLTGRWSKEETERLRTLVNAYMSQKQVQSIYGHSTVKANYCKSKSRYSTVRVGALCLIPL